MKPRAPSKLRSVPRPAAANDRQRRVQRELAHVRRQLVEAQRLAALGTTAAMLAHEFNNMMTPIVGYAKFALTHRDPDVMTKALETTLGQSQAIMAMAERVLAMAAPTPPEYQLVSLANIVDRAVQCLCRDPAKDGITLLTDIPPGLCVWADEQRLQQVLFNLLLNARDALGGRRGTLRIGAVAESEGVRLALSDTGCGIAPADLPAVFEPFFTTKRAGDDRDRAGSGLGLSICRDIVRDHHGRITVESELGRGTTFTVMLPAKSPSAPRAAARSGPRPARP